MELLLLSTRLLLGLVFLAAGVACLVDPSRSRAAMVAFGAPARFAAPLGLLLGLLELCVGVALLPVPASWDPSVRLLAVLALTALSLIKPAAPRRHPRAPQPRVRHQLVA